MPPQRAQFGCIKEWSLAAERWFDGTVEPVGTGSFCMATQSRTVGTGLVAHLDYEGKGSTFARTAEANRFDYDVALLATHRGSATYTVGGEQTSLRAGDVLLLGSGMPFHKVLSRDYEETLLLVGGGGSRDPHGNALTLAGNRGYSVARASQGDMTTYLGQAMRQSAGVNATPGTDQYLLSSLILLARGAFVGCFSAPDSGESQATLHRRQRALSYIDDNLHRPDLTPRSMAAELGLSLRYLHILFEATGETAAATIWERRLTKSHQILADPSSDHLRISEVAYCVGFSSAQHFSRAFKKRFGMTPSEVRQRRGTR